MEARAGGTSKRVITKEGRRSLFHYFALRPPTPLENAFSREDAPSGASTLSGASIPSGDGHGRGAEGFSRKALVQSSSVGEETGRAQDGLPLNATVPPCDGPLGGGESSVTTTGETRTVESETRRGERRSGSALAKVFGRPRPDGVDVMKSIEAGARGQQLPDRAVVGQIVDGRLAGDSSHHAFLYVMLLAMCRQDDHETNVSCICAEYLSRERMI